MLKVYDFPFFKFFVNTIPADTYC